MPGLSGDARAHQSGISKPGLLGEAQVMVRDHQADGGVSCSDHTKGGVQSSCFVNQHALEAPAAQLGAADCAAPVRLTTPRGPHLLLREYPVSVGHVSFFLSHRASESRTRGEAC